MKNSTTSTIIKRINLRTRLIKRKAQERTEARSRQDFLTDTVLKWEIMGLNSAQRLDKKLSRETQHLFTNYQNNLKQVFRQVK